MNSWYYSKNGERQGPVSFAELKALASRGELNGITDLAWTEGMKDWTPSGQVPGLFDGTPAAAPAAFNPYAAPATAPQDLLAPEVSSGLTAIPPGSYQLEVMRVLGRGMQITNRHFGPIVGIGIVYILLTAAFEACLEFINDEMGIGSTGFVMGGLWPSSPYAEDQLHPVLGLISWTLSVFLQVGLTRVALNFASGDKAALGMLLGEGRLLLRSMGANILYMLIVGGGLLLLIVPGIYWALKFVMYQDAIVDRNLGIIDAFKYSARLTSNNKLNLFGFGLMTLLIVVAGALALVVGLIYALPVVTVAFAVAYRSLQFGPQAMMDFPGTQTPLLKGVCVTPQA